jgi:hypothetical protein
MKNLIKLVTRAHSWLELRASKYFGVRERHGILWAGGACEKTGFATRGAANRFAIANGIKNYVIFDCNAIDMRCPDRGRGAMSPRNQNPNQQRRVPTR